MEIYYTSFKTYKIHYNRKDRDKINSLKDTIKYCKKYILIEVSDIGGSYIKVTVEQDYSPIHAKMIEELVRSFDTSKKDI